VVRAFSPQKPATIITTGSFLEQADKTKEASSEHRFIRKIAITMGHVFRVISEHYVCKMSQPMNFPQYLLLHYFLPICQVLSLVCQGNNYLDIIIQQIHITLGPMHVKLTHSEMQQTISHSQQYFVQNRYCKLVFPHLFQTERKILVVCKPGILVGYVMFI